MRPHAKDAECAEAELFDQTVRDPLDPILQMNLTKVDQQPEPMATEPQLREHLFGLHEPSLGRRTHRGKLRLARAQLLLNLSGTCGRAALGACNLIKASRHFIDLGAVSLEFTCALGIDLGQFGHHFCVLIEECAFATLPEKRRRERVMRKSAVQFIANLVFM